jgi:hypothetical protein
MSPPRRRSTRGRVRGKLGPVTDISSVDGATPELVAALLVLGLVPAERLPWIAAEWLVAGRGAAVTGELSGLNSRDVREAGDLLPLALQELEVTVPDGRVAAATVYFSHLATHYQAGQASAERVLHAVEYIDSGAYETGVHELPLGTLYGLLDEWNGGWGRRPAQLREMITRACRDQLERHPMVAAPEPRSRGER